LVGRVDSIKKVEGDIGVILNYVSSDLELFLLQSNTGTNLVHMHKYVSSFED